MNEEVTIIGQTHDEQENRCCVIVPVYDCIENACQLSLNALEDEGYYVLRESGGSAIDIGRSLLASKMLCYDFDEIMFIDSDVSFHPTSVDKLRKHNLDFVCAPLVQKGSGKLAMNFTNSEGIKFGEGAGLREINECHMGFTMIKTKVFEKIKKQFALPLCNDMFDTGFHPYFQPLIQKVNDKHWYKAEDYAFCERVRQCGFRLMSENSVEIWHIGKYGFSWRNLNGIEQTFFNQTYKAG